MSEYGARTEVDRMGKSGRENRETSWEVIGISNTRKGVYEREREREKGGRDEREGE